LSDYTDKGTVRRATETRPANYLSKPFTEQDLLRAIDIALYNANAARATNDSDEEFVFLKTEQVYSKFQYGQIVFVEAERAYCKIHTLEKIVRLPISMAAVAEQLNKDRFVKIHRSYLVNIRKVTEFSGDEITVAGHKLPVSDQHRAEVMTRLNILH
jgi:DNA-binding LytR/AlgR family response regulator